MLAGAATPGLVEKSARLSARQSPEDAKNMGKRAAGLRLRRLFEARANLKNASGEGRGCEVSNLVRRNRKTMHRPITPNDHRASSSVRAKTVAAAGGVQEEIPVRRC